MPQETIRTGPQRRAARIEAVRAEGEERSLDLAFSSEEPVRRWFGAEILDHAPGAVRVQRVGQRAVPLLMDHNTRDVVGVVENVRIGNDRVGRATVRFGRSARADEILRDVADGIRSAVSVGYAIHELRLESSGEDGDVYRATDWEPLEISIVAVPADPTVGIGRSDDGEIQTRIIREERAMPPETQSTTTTPTQPAAPAAPAAPETRAAPAAPVVDVNQVREEALRAERERVREINELGGQHGRADLAAQHVAQGSTVDAFRTALLTALRAGARPVDPNAADVGLSDREANRYSVVRLLNALANPTVRRAQEAAGFELEAGSAAAQRMGVTPRGVMVPHDVLRRAVPGAEGRRDLQASVFSQGGALVATDLLSGSFIDLLRNRLIMAQVGSTMLTGLTGNVAIPKQTGGATAYWISPEGAEPTESTPALGQVTLSPKTVGAFTDYTRQLLLQSSLDVEAFVRNDLSRVLALAIDLASVYGTGASGQPAGITATSGINTKDFAAANPTYAELVAMESLVAQDNADVGTLAYIVEPTMRGTLKTTEKFSSTGQTVWEPGNTINGYRTGVSAQLTDGDVVFGNFADWLIGMWGGLDLMADPYSLSKSGSVRIVAHQSIDMAARNAVSFCWGNDAQ